MPQFISRIPSDDQYLVLLGKAVYDFAYMEWTVKYLGCALDSSFLNQSAKLTSNKIAEKLKRMDTERILSDSHRAEYLSIIDDFAGLTVSRDQLLHANPYTDDMEGQRLAYRGRHPSRNWASKDLEDLIAQISAVAVRANKLWHSNWISRSHNSQEA